MWSPRNILAAAVLFTAAPAMAGSDSLFTVGLGTTMGVNRSTPLGGIPETTFTSELSLKFKMLYFLGLEFAYAPTDSSESASTLIFDANFRLSALIYLVPTTPVSFYLKGGLGAGNMVDLFAIDKPTTNYHAGAGFDINIGDNFVLGAEYLLLIPGMAGVRETLSSYANEEIKRYQSREDNAVASSRGETPSVSDFISPQNFRVTVSARWYF
jgi:hypothetical protein